MHIVIQSHFINIVADKAEVELNEDTGLELKGWQFYFLKNFIS